MSEDPGSTAAGRPDEDDGQSIVREFRGWMRALLRRRNGDGQIRETLEDLIEDREEAEVPIDPDERTLIANILALHDMTAEDVMVPRADIVAVPEDAPQDELITLISEEAHSRLPVYRENLDEVVGMVHIKDVLSALKSQGGAKVSELVRRILFVAPSMRVLDLLLEMRQSRIHMAIVVDEYGGVDGIVTIEDVVEEIVGEIEDEHDVAQGPTLTRRDDGTVLADARTELEEFEDFVGPVFGDAEREENDTLGGVVFALVDRVPQRGEIVRHPSGLEFEVLGADPRRIHRLRVRNLPHAAAAPAAASSSA